MSVQVTLLGKGLCTDVTLEWLVTNIVPVEVHYQVTVAKEGTRAELTLKEPLACVNLKVSFQVALTGKCVGAKVTLEPSLFACVCQRPSCRRIGFFGDHCSALEILLPPSIRPLLLCRVPHYRREF